MNSDKFIFSIIGGITLIIFGFIVYSSFSTSKFSPENLLPEEVIGSNSHKKGAENPKVTLVEFADFECPACESVNPYLNSLVEKYPNDLAVVYRHFPLPMHKDALPTAKASEAAAMQGKFWEYHAKLYDNFEKYSSDNLIEYAQQLGLDVDKFKSDSASSEAAAKVAEDADFAKKINLSGTPSFFLVYGDKVESISISTFNDLEVAIKRAAGIQ